MKVNINSSVHHSIWIVVVHCMMSVLCDEDLVHDSCDKISLEGTYNSHTAFEGYYSVQKGWTCDDRPVYTKDEGETKYLLYVNGYGWRFRSEVSHGDCDGDSHIRATSNVALPNLVTEVWTESDLEVEVPSIRVQCLDIHKAYIQSEFDSNQPECDIGTRINIVQASYGFGSASYDHTHILPNMRSYCEFPIRTDDEYFEHIHMSCNDRQNCTDLIFSSCKLFWACGVNEKETNYVSIQYQCLRNSACSYITVNFNMHQSLYYQNTAQMCNNRNVYRGTTDFWGNAWYLFHNGDYWIHVRKYKWYTSYCSTDQGSAAAYALGNYQYLQDIPETKWITDSVSHITISIVCYVPPADPYDNPDYVPECPSFGSSSSVSTHTSIPTASTPADKHTTVAQVPSFLTTIASDTTDTTFSTSSMEITMEQDMQDSQQGINTILIAAVCASVLTVIIVAAIVAVVVVVKRQKKKSEPSSNLDQQFRTENNVYFNGKNVAIPSSTDTYPTPEHNPSLPPSENMNTILDPSYELAGNDNPVYEMAGPDEPGIDVPMEDMLHQTPEPGPTSDLYTLPNKGLRHDDDLVVQDNTNYHSYDTQDDDLVIEENTNYQSVPEQYAPSDDTIVEDNINYQAFNGHH